MKRYSHTCYYNNQSVEENYDIPGMKKGQDEGWNIQIKVKTYQIKVN